MKILIIDDERSIRETLEMFLREKEYEVITAKDGERGLEAIQKERLDIVILDIHLPGMDGLAVLKKIKERGENTSVIMITAYHDTETAMRAIKIGADEYVRKPIDVDEFEIIIDKVVNKSAQPPVRMSEHGL